MKDLFSPNLNNNNMTVMGRGCQTCAGTCEEACGKKCSGTCEAVCKEDCQKSCHDTCGMLVIF